MLRPEDVLVAERKAQGFQPLVDSELAYIAIAALLQREDAEAAA